MMSQFSPVPQSFQNHCPLNVRHRKRGFSPLGEAKKHRLIPLPPPRLETHGLEVGDKIDSFAPSLGDHPICTQIGHRLLQVHDEAKRKHRQMGALLENSCETADWLRCHPKECDPFGERTNKTRQEQDNLMRQSECLLDLYYECASSHRRSAGNKVSEAIWAALWKHGYDDNKCT